MKTDKQEAISCYFTDMVGRRDLHYIPNESEFHRKQWNEDRGKWEGPGIYYISEFETQCGDIQYTWEKMNDTDTETLLEFCEFLIEKSREILKA